MEKSNERPSGSECERPARRASGSTVWRIEHRVLNERPSGANVNETLIKLESIAKVFVTDDVETHALSDIVLTVKKGEYLSIEGQSGSGKTTLLSIFGLLESPSSGRYTLAEHEVARLSAAERAHLRNRHIGFIFQSF